MVKNFTVFTKGKPEKIHILVCITEHDGFESMIKLLYQHSNVYHIIDYSWKNDVTFKVAYCIAVSILTNLASFAQIKMVSNQT